MNQIHKSWVCSQCKYSSDTFRVLIKKKAPPICNAIIINNLEPKHEYNITNTNNNNKIDTSRKLNSNLNDENDEIIAINFTSSDQEIKYCIPCKMSDQFKTALNKLYAEYPEYQKKKFFF